MTRQEVKALHAVLLADLRLTMYRLAIVPLADQTYAILVDGTITEHVRQVAFYSATEWQEREQTLAEGGLFRLMGMPDSFRERLKQFQQGGRG